MEREIELKRLINKEFLKPFMIIGRITVLSPILAWLFFIGSFIWLSFSIHGGNAGSGVLMLFWMIAVFFALPVLVLESGFGIAYEIFMATKVGLGAIISLGLYTLTAGIESIGMIIIVLSGNSGNASNFAFIACCLLVAAIIAIGYLLTLALHVVIIIFTVKTMKKVKPWKEELKDIKTNKATTTVSK